MLILDLWDISFHAVVIFGLGKNLLFKSILGRCVYTVFNLDIFIKKKIRYTVDFFVSATSSTVHLLLISTVEFCKIPFCPWLVALLTLPFFFCFAYYRAIQILRLYIYNNFWLNPTATLLCQGVLCGHNRGLASNGQKWYQI